MLTIQILSEKTRCNTICEGSQVHLKKNSTCIEKENTTIRETILGSGIKNNLLFSSLYFFMFSKYFMLNIFPFK